MLSQLLHYSYYILCSSLIYTFAYACSTRGVVETLPGHNGPITGIHQHPSRGEVDFGDLVLTSSTDWSMKLWSKTVCTCTWFWICYTHEEKYNALHTYIHIHTYSPNYHELPVILSAYCSFREKSLLLLMT